MFISIVPLLGIINYNLPSFCRRTEVHRHCVHCFLKADSPADHVIHHKEWCKDQVQSKLAAAHSRKISSTFCIVKCIQRHLSSVTADPPQQDVSGHCHISCLPLQWHHRTNMHARESKIPLWRDWFTIYKGRLLMRTGRYLELGLQSIRASDIAVTRQLRVNIDAITETGNLPCITHEVCDKVGNFHNPQ